MSVDGLLLDALESGAQFWVEEGRLSFRAPRGGFDPGLRARLRRRRDELLALLEPGVRYAPLSFAQQRLWFLDRFTPGLAAYNLPSGFRLLGRLRPAALEAALAALAERQESLRATFPSREGRPYVRIPARDKPELERLDLGHLAEAEREAEVAERYRRQARQPFDLSRGPLLRAQLIRLGPEDHALLLTVHHMISDGWSQAVLFQELGMHYATQVRAETSPLEPLAARYSDFAAWQRRRLSGELLATGLSHWRRHLEGAPDLELPSDRPRRANQTDNGGSYRFELSRELAARLERLGRESGATLFMTLLAGFQALLHRHSSQSDFVVGSPIANRSRSELESLIGLFVNTLPLRAELAGDPSFMHLVERVRETTLAAYAHQEMPFEKMVEELQPHRDASKNPLFQVSFALQNAPAPLLALPCLEVRQLSHPEMATHFDLELFCWPSDGAISSTFLFNADLFDGTRIARLADHYLGLLGAAVEQPRRPLSELGILGRAERHQLLVGWTDTLVGGGESRAIHEVFERRVADTPGATAILAERGELTYGELNLRANRLARHLRDLGVGTDHRVALYLERSPEFLIAMLAVLKAGGAFAPLQLADPEARLEQALKVAWTGQLEPRLLLTTTALRARLPRHSGRVLALDDLEPRLRQLSGSNLETVDRRDALAYVLFTSGSTGRPKGVAMPHGPVLNLLSWHRGRADREARERTLQFSSLGFDVAFQEMFTTWDAGGTLVLVSAETQRDPERLLELLLRTGAARLFLPYVALRQLAEVVDRRRQLDLGLKRLISAGEQLVVTPAIARLVARLGQGAVLENHYGPTETHIVTALSLTGDPSAWPLSPPIGRAVDNCRAHVLDRRLEPVPIGIPGELFIAGAQVARGYLGLPARTAAAFLPDPFGERPGGRMYRTGDRARYLPDGRIEFLGRLDHQLKIRGFRVEPGEIESALAEHPDVRAAVVTAPATADGRPELVAYVVPRSSGLQAASLSAFLRRRLPDYLVPRRFMLLAEFPLTASGKLDRKGLPAPDVRASGRRSGGASYTPAEGVLAEILGELLEIEEIEPADDFFELGGHSLLAIRLLNAVERRLGVRLPVAALFASPTVAELAVAIGRSHPADDASPVVALQPDGSGTPFFCIHPIGGNVLCYLDLARQMGAERPFYGLQAALGSPPRDLHELAAAYVRALVGAQPDGPYHLGGWSLGGLVSFEMAHQLRAAGREVASLSLLDVAPPDGPRLRGQALRQLALRVLAEQLRIPDELPSLAELEALVGGPAAPDRPAGVEPRSVGRIYRTIESLLEGAGDYRPEPYPGRVGLFLAALRPDPERLEGAWQELSQEVDRHTVPGDHFTMMERPYAASLAAVLGDYLGRFPT